MPRLQSLIRNGKIKLLWERPRLYRELFPPNTDPLQEISQQIIIYNDAQTCTEYIQGGDLRGPLLLFVRPGKWTFGIEHQIYSVRLGSLLYIENSTICSFQNRLSLILVMLVIYSANPYICPDPLKLGVRPNNCTFDSVLQIYSVQDSYIQNETSYVYSRGMGLYQECKGYLESKAGRRSRMGGSGMHIYRQAKPNKSCAYVV